MTSIGSNHSFHPPMKQPVGGGGCNHGGGPELVGGGPTRTDLDMTEVGGRFGDMMQGAMPPATEGERFQRSQAGGLLLDKAGEPAGRVPENSVFDSKTGKVYGPDGAPIALPDGGSVDFFDLGDVDGMRQAYASFMGEPIVGGGEAPMKVPAKGGTVGGEHGDAGCDMDKPMPKGGKDMHVHGGGSTVGGASGGGALAKGGGSTGHDHAVGGMHGAGFPTAFAGPVLGGGLVGGATGSGMLGTMPGLEASLASLIATLQQLAMAISGGGSMGGGPGQMFPGFPGQLPDQVSLPEPVQLPIQTPSQVLGATGSGDKAGMPTQVLGATGSGGKAEVPTTTVGGASGGGSATEPTTTKPADKPADTPVVTTDATVGGTSGGGSGTEPTPAKPADKPADKPVGKPSDKPSNTTGTA